MEDQYHEISWNVWDNKWEAEKQFLKGQVLEFKKANKILRKKVRALEKELGGPIKPLPTPKVKAKTPQPLGIPRKTCVYCGVKFGESVASTSDHIIPKSRGGCNHGHNRTRACVECNEKKGNEWPSLWVAMNDKLRPKYLEALECWRRDK